MAREIERKFLVKGEFRQQAVKRLHITQAYLSVDPLRIVRIRISDEKAYLAVKGPHGQDMVTRNEWEIEIPSETAHEILEICIPGRIEKTRYIVPYKGHNFEVDEFHGKNEGLIVAEIELGEAGEEFEKPSWLGKEVTGIPGYQNSNLI